MKKFKKLLSVLLVATMIFTTFSMGISVSAENVTTETTATSDSPLEIEVTTNKSSYGLFDVAEITVTVTNISDETVENISAQAVFDDLAPVDSLYSETSKKAETLKPGENFSFSYKATLSLDNSDVGFFSKIILWFVRIFNDGYTVISGDSEADIENVTEIKFGKVSADNKIKVWYEYDSESIVTRGEWILMLSDILDWENKIVNINFDQIDCFNDILGEECEKAVKCASTLGLFDNTTGQFYPDSPATREFVAVTAVRALNFYETESIDCLDKSQIQHPKEVNTAINTGVLQIENNYFYPNKILTVNQINNVLEKISDILDSTIVDENHQNEISYNDNVIELSKDVEYQQNGTNFEFSISAETDKLEVGSIFVLSDCTSYKITSINQKNGKYIVKTEEATIEETIKSINIEGAENISSGSFIPADGVEIVQPRTRSAISMENINLKVKKEVEQDIFLYAELSIKDPRVEYKVDIDWSNIIPYFNNVYLKFIFDMEVKGGFSSNDSGKKGPSKAGGISLGKYPVVGALGTGIYIEVALEYSVDGKIELVMTLHGETGFQIYNNQPRGIAELSPNFEFPSLEANAKFGPKISGLLCIIRKWDLIDFSLYAGAAVKSSLKIRDTGISCLSAHGYVFAELQALKEGVIGDWLNLEYNWKIWDEENSFIKKQWHFENLIYVPECTYGDKETDFVNVSGTIRDSETGEPIEGVTIYCEEMGTSCVTDKNGRFTIAIKSFSIGHTFKITHEDYEWKRITVASDSYSLIEEITLERKDNSEPETKQYTVSGTVKDETTGNAISGVRVEFVDNSSDSFDPVATATTNENGLFSVKLPYGSYSLSFNHDNYEYYGTTVNVDTENVVLTEPILLTPKNSSGGGSDDRTVIDSGSCGADGDNVTWTLYDDGELVISGSGAMADYYFNPTKTPWCAVQSSITKLTIKNGVVNIGDWAFNNCSNLTSITIPDSMTSIGGHAFLGCSDIKSITIPNSVTTIGEWAFHFCSSLKSITIPNSVKSIGNYAFNDCNNLTNVYYSGTKVQWNNIDIGNYNSDLLNATIHYNS